MKTKDEMKSVPSFNDLVFENRNKEYGAYKMREKYNSALIWSILVSVFFLSASVITPFVIEMGKPVVIPNTPETPPEIVITTIDPNILRPDEPKQVEIKTKPVYVAPEVVDSVQKNDANQLPTNDDLNITVKNDSVTDVIPVNTDKVDPVVENTDPVDVIFVSEKPSFGTEGDNEFRKWIAENIHYPQVLSENGIQGRVYVQFIVEKDGSLSNIIAARSIDPELGKEAVRVVSLSPKWNPGKQQGYPVRVRYTFPITFSIK